MIRFTVYLWIGLGGMLGSMLRYGLSSFFKTESSWIGTGLINTCGSFLIGLILAWTQKNQVNDQFWNWFLAIGFCGGFTTFSTFSWENLQLMQSGKWTLAACYTLCSLMLGFIAVWTGYRIGQIL